MNRSLTRLAAFFALFQLFVVGGPALAQAGGDPYRSAQGSMRTVAIDSWVEEWDPATNQWVRVAESRAPETSSQNTQHDTFPTVTTTYVGGVAVSETREAARFASSVDTRGQAEMLAQYGPFVVTGTTTASMVGATDSATPAYFDAMLRDYPGLARLNMVEAPGTSNDIANLAVGRRIREAGIATHVPQGGSVRSGAVELFLAGATRTMEQGAQFAVHSWLDNHGREADDFAANHPAHRLYLDYYVEMGMSEQQARDFYDMTNSVPHHSALWLGASDMQPWLAQPRTLARTPAYRMAAATPASKPDQPLSLAVFAAPALAVIAVEPVEIANPAFAPELDYTDMSAVNLALLDRDQLDSGLSFP